MHEKLGEMWWHTPALLRMGHNWAQTSPKSYPPSDPPSNSKSSISKHISLEIVAAKRGEFRLELAKSRRSAPEWTLTGAPSGHRTRSRLGYPSLATADLHKLSAWLFEVDREIPAPGEEGDPKSRDRGEGDARARRAEGAGAHA